MVMKSGRLAIHGGEPARPAPIKPRIVVADTLLDSVRELIEDGCFSDWYGGPRAHEFEREFAKYLGAGYAVAVNSGTSALHLAVAAAGFGPGDEVLMPAAAYISAASVVLQQQATPVLCDIDAATMTIDPADAERRITERTKGILPVHFWGCTTDMERVCQLAGRYRLLVIEDCGQSHGARVASRYTGAIGDFGCFSLAPRKQLSTGQGGIVTCRSEENAQRVRELANKGKGPGWLDYHTLGFSYVMPEFEALLGLSGLLGLDLEVKRRRAACDLYRKILSDIPLSIPVDPPWGDHVYFKVPIVLPREAKGQRDFMVEALLAENVSCRPPHPPFYEIAWLSAESTRLGRPLKNTDYPVTADLLPRIIELESGPNMTPEDVEVSARAVAKVWSHITQTSAVA
jgi:perosamine synthetase